jgi:hypothetical protein
MKRAFAIFLLVLTLFSQSGVVLAAHYCMGDLAEWNLGFSTHAESCSMAKKPTACEQTNDFSSDDMRRKGCCEDDFVQFKINEPCQTTSEILVSVSPVFVVAFVMAMNFDLWANSVHNHSFLAYSPPPLLRDIPVLNQSFLI